LNVEEGLRLHYLDEGDAKGPVILLLHGEPTWSYLYRKMIPVLAAAGFRVLAPDLIGFGKSDKWTEQKSYSYQKHIDWVTSFLIQLDLKAVTLFGQDWGGLIGLRLVAAMPERFAGIVASNTILPTGQGVVPDAFYQWRAYSQKSPDLNIGKVIRSGTVKPMPDEVAAAYDAPFPSEEYKAGARIFPTLVPVEEKDPEAIQNKKAWQALMQWEKPVLTVFGDADEIMKGAEKIFQKLMPGAKGQDHAMLHAGHFIQEDVGEELARLVVAFIQKNTPKK